MKTDAESYHFLQGSALPGRGSITQHVTDVLRGAIVTLAFRPGEVLDKGLICERLGVSRFPVSEALARLAAEGLVDILPQRGTSVSLVRVAEVLEHMLIRRAIEAEAVRLLAGHPDKELIDELRGNLAQQARAADEEDSEGFHQLDLEFHDMLFAALRFPKIKAVIEGARANVDRARRLINSPRRLALTIAEHEAVVATISKGQADGAAAAMRAHLDAVMIELVSFATQRPELFADGGEPLDPRFREMMEPV
jgi:GntR family transcriptional regulator, rspAB operon transcriptional repressor